MKPIRQGDVILVPVAAVAGEPILGLTLAEGEVTGYRHQITAGRAKLYQQDETLYLEVFSGAAVLTHDEHAPIAIPRGVWMVRIQREYEPQGWRHLTR